MALPLIDIIHWLNRNIDSYCKFSWTIQGVQTQQIIHNINVDWKIYLKKYTDYSPYTFIQNISSNSFLPIFPQIKFQKNQKYYFIINKTSQNIRTVWKENYVRYDDFSKTVKRETLSQNPTLSWLKQDPNELVKIEIKKKIAELPFCDFSNSKANSQNKLEYEQIQHYTGIYFLWEILFSLLVFVFLIKTPKALNLFLSKFIVWICVLVLIPMLCCMILNIFNII